MGARVERRRWGVENFAAVCDALADEAHLIVFGGPNDKALVDKLQSLTEAPLWIAVGQFSPRQSAALMKRCATVITSDTGPMHLAMAVDTPVVALFGIDSFVTARAARFWAHSARTQRGLSADGITALSLRKPLRVFERHHARRSGGVQTRAN